MKKPSSSLQQQQASGGESFRQKMVLFYEQNCNLYLVAACIVDGKKVNHKTKVNLTTVDRTFYNSLGVMSISFRTVKQ